MNTFNKMPNCILLAVLFCLVSFQQQCQAQWVTDGKDSYKSEAERFRALDQALTILEKSKPMVDLNLSLKKNDFRFVSYIGYSLTVPGVPNKQIIYMMKHRMKFKVLKGSNDVVNEQLSKRQQKVIKNYMEPYNRALLKILGSKDANFKV